MRDGMAWLLCESAGEPALIRVNQGDDYAMAPADGGVDACIGLP